MIYGFKVGVAVKYRDVAHCFDLSYRHMMRELGRNAVQTLVHYGMIPIT